MHSWTNPVRPATWQLPCAGVIRRHAASFQRPSPQSRGAAGVLIPLGTIVGLIVILLTAVNPVGTAIGFVLSSVAMAGVVLAYLWLDRWEPEPPRLLVLAFLWGASVAVARCRWLRALRRVA